ncbi:hypothetical protein cypCar_00046978 [Cyprinus carpio]|nr:hypothetical protein cypCar_00046978 [Cyprinus carpio]
MPPAGPLLLNSKPGECTADKKFVFVVYNDFANIPVNPMSLMFAGKPGCKPVISNKDFAIFKFSVSFMNILYPNPLDSGSTSILYMKDLPQNRHQCAFQFMDLSTRKYLNEEATTQTRSEA